MTVQRNSFDRSVNEARAASVRGDISAFSHFVWSALSEFTKNYFQENFFIFIRTEEEIESFYKDVCAGLNGSDAADISEIWVDAFWYHSLLDAGFIPKEEMDDIIERLDQIPDIFEKADVKKMKNELIIHGLIETPSTLKRDVIHTQAKLYAEEETNTDLCSRHLRKRKHSTISVQTYVRKASKSYLPWGSLKVSGKGVSL